MDRLSFVILAALVGSVGGCDDDAPVAKSSGSRVDAVTAKAPKVDLAGFCDNHAQAATAKSFVMPELGAGTPGPSKGWRWINVWATWCRPCVEELPLIAGLKDKFAADHLPLSVEFLSVDATADEVRKFEASHPGTPSSLRIKDAGALPAWLGAIGLDESSALPIHLFVDDNDKIRCVRMGAIEASHYDTVRAMVRAG
jgi:thiol-disulfide isomerase/thioredoxin